MISRRSTLLASLAALAAGPLARAQDSPFPKGPRAGAPPPTDYDPALAALIEGAQRSPANRARDAWRHPLESLSFWGIQPGLTVVDIDPGGGYWTEIIAPYLAQGGGRYVAAMADPDDPAISDAARRGVLAFKAKYGDASTYGPIAFAPFSAAKGLTFPAGSADLILFCRYFHNLMWIPGAVATTMDSFDAALGAGGVLAVEEHRADPRPMVLQARDGYVAEDVVIAAARNAGLKFDKAAEINANPKDTKDYPFGVWTLPPTRRSAPEGQPADPNFDHAKYDAIGESDRMTLRFKKPE
jgi:predicted methyltransferase